jgi:5-methylcytosine-specific restriction protein A
LCEECEHDNRIKPADLVHHIIPLTDGGKRLDHDNLMAVCSRCHTKIHGRM